MQRLAHGARLAHSHVDWSTSCEVGITVTLSRRVSIDDDIPVTNVDSVPACSRALHRLVWHLTARRVPTIFVALDRRTHRILYIRPDRDARARP